jgi:hypothetical protein
MGLFPGEERMKYMIEWTFRTTGLTHEQTLAGEEALTNAFSKWKKAGGEEGFNILAHVSNIARTGGYVLVEASDPNNKVIASVLQKFIYWNDHNVVPVIDADESVSISQSGLSWAVKSSKG